MEDFDIELSRGSGWPWILVERVQGTLKPALTIAKQWRGLANGSADGPWRARARGASKIVEI